ncbi:MAG: hypothetical protein ACFBWO_04790 [Paracoccaceae bacterium]
MLLNNRLSPEFEVVDASALAIAERSLSTLIKSHARGTVATAEAFARASEVDFRFAAIGADFDEAMPAPFDRGYMTALFTHGRARALAGRAWDGAALVAADEAGETPGREGAAG